MQGFLLCTLSILVSGWSAILCTGLVVLLDVCENSVHLLILSILLCLKFFFDLLSRLKLGWDLIVFICWQGSIYI